MINMAVVNLKDILKYFLKITIVIVVIVGVTKYVANAKNPIDKINIGNNTTFLSCFDITIPGIASLNHEIAPTNNSNKQDPLQLALGIELEMITSVKQKENVDELASNNTSEEENTQTNSQNAGQNTENSATVQKAETGLKTEVQESNVPEKYSTQYNGVKIRNETDYKLTDEILTPDIEINKENILIFHTHTCESYTASEKYQYKQTGNFRTTDRNYSVVRVGRELKDQLTNYGYNVIHDETYHDYPSYSGSYSNSLKTVTQLLKENENTDIVLDLHRDAIGDNTYAPTVKIGDEYAAQLMFVIGGNGSSIKHENWQQNLKFAIMVQEKANELYPGLFKPIILRYSGYNQHVAKAAAIIEVGATGNTLDQTLVSMKYLAKVLDEVLK